MSPATATPPTRAGQAPVQARARIELLDTLRGFALYGILFANLTWFTGWAVLSPEARAALPTHALDPAADAFIHIAVDGKFWSLFALLFGAGYALQAGRAEQRGEDAAFRSFWNRRAVALLAIGAVHAVALWFGDILTLYATVGLALPFVASGSARVLGLRAAALLLAPIPISVLWLAGSTALAGATPADDPGHGPGALLPAFAHGRLAEMWHANAVFLKERWLRALLEGRFLKLLGMFVVGVAAVRMGLHTAPDRHRVLLRRTLAVGLLVGVPVNLLLATVDVPLRPPTLGGTVVAALRTVGVPALALAYASGFALLASTLRGRRLLAVFAPAGRVSLSAYLGQTLVGIAIFYGVGLGAWGTVGATWIPLIATLVFVVQSLAARAWLARFRHGPAEWLWRATTYARRLPWTRTRQPQGVVDPARSR